MRCRYKTVVCCQRNKYNWFNFFFDYMKIRKVHSTNSRTILVSFEKSRKTRIIFVLSVRISVRPNGTHSATTRQIFVKFYTLLKAAVKNNVWLISDKHNRHFCIVVKPYVVNNIKKPHYCVPMATLLILDFRFSANVIQEKWQVIRALRIATILTTGHNVTLYVHCRICLKTSRTKRIKMGSPARQH